MGTREAEAGKIRIAASDGAEMVYVPAGWFVQGSLEGYPGSDPDEYPQRKVYLDAYWIDRREVTNEQYARFVEATERRGPLYWENAQIPEGQAEFPVVGISWADARAYAQWAGKDLPTEAQWEKAARGDDGRQFPWGNDWVEGRANNTARMAPVGSHPNDESPYGCLDMAGNAWEWCRDWYNLYWGYDRMPDSNPTGPEDSHRYWYRGQHFRVVRGGYYADGRPARTADRLGDVPPETRYWAIGFRCASAHVPEGINPDDRGEVEQRKVIRAPASAVRPRKGRLTKVRLPSFEIEVGHPAVVAQSKGFENGDIGYYHYMGHFERLPDGTIALSFHMHPDCTGPYPPIDSANLASLPSAFRALVDREIAVRVSRNDGSSWALPDPPMAMMGNLLADGSMITVRSNWGRVAAESRGAILQISHDMGQTARCQGLTLDTRGLKTGRIYMWTVTSTGQMPGGHLLALAMCKVEGDDWWRNILLRSDDGGRSWHYVSTVMGAEKPSHGGFEEETAMALCANGDLLAVARLGKTRPLRHMAQAISSDGGKTWTAPIYCPGIPGVLWPFHSGNVSPALLPLDSGVMAVAYGRPAGLQVAFSPDGRGQHWEPLTLMGAMREGLLEQEYGIMSANDMTIPGNLGAQLGVAAHMPRMLALDADRFLLAFDVDHYSPFVVEDSEARDLVAPDPDYPARNTVFVIPITVKRRG